MHDIFKIYKQFYQRSYKNPNDYEFFEMTELIHDLAQLLYKKRNNKLLSVALTKQGLKVAKELLILEKEKGVPNYFSRNLINTFSSNQFEIKVPFQVSQRWEENGYSGSIYILTAPSRLKECKLGATYLDIDTRMRKYRNRHGYQVILYYKQLVIDPLNKEYLISKKNKTSKSFR